MNELDINGKKYVKASVLAKNLGYTSDYVGQLCRAGKVEAAQVGRSWFVAADSLTSHRKERVRSNHVKSTEAIAAYKKHSVVATPSTETTRARHISIHHYETDDTELMPHTKKTPVSETKSSVALTTKPAPAATKKHLVEKTVKTKQLAKTSHFVASEPAPVSFSGTLEIANVETEDTPEPAATVPKADLLTPTSVKQPSPAVFTSVAAHVPSANAKKATFSRLITMGLLFFGLIFALTVLQFGLVKQWNYTGNNINTGFGINLAHFYLK